MKNKNILIIFFMLCCTNIFGQPSSTQLFSCMDAGANKLILKWYLPKFISEEPVILWKENQDGNWQKLSNQSFGFSKAANTGSLTQKEKELFEICKNSTQLNGVMLLHVLMQSFTSRNFAEVAGFGFTTSLEETNSKTRFKITGEQTGKVYFLGAAISYKKNESFPGSAVLKSFQKKAGVQIFWKNTPAEVWGLLLYRRHSDSAQQVLLTPQPLLKSADTSKPESRSFMDVSTREKQTYNYRLKGITHFGDTVLISNTLLYQCLDQSPPPAVQNLRCTSKKRQVQVSWTATPTEDCAYYKILRTQKNDTDYVVIGKTANSATSTYQDTINRFQSYFYKIRSFDEAGNFSECNPQAIDVPDTEPPSSAEITEISADSISILLKWKANVCEDFAGCYVYRTINDTTNSHFVRITPEPIKEMEFRDILPTNTKNRYYYKLLTCDSSLNYSKYSALVSVRLPDKSCPSKVFITTVEQKKEGLRINWFKNPELDIKNYLLSIYDSCAKQKLPIIKIHRDSTNINLTNLRQNCMYSFYLQAQDSSENMSPVGVARFFTLRTLEEQDVENEKIQFKAQEVEDSLAFKFHWRITSQDSVRGYTLYRADNQENDARPISGFITNSKFYIDASIQKNYNYTYHLRALLYNGRIIQSQSIKVSTHEKQKSKRRKSKS